ncbi:hypothetical protein BC835DRAFT_877831 [Cytidiella melzeri]|nr:hypothetical protein BC835DRAFT_877831 [Cytidiella melzeri]
MADISLATRCSSSSFPWLACQRGCYSSMLSRHAVLDLARMDYAVVAIFDILRSRYQYQVACDWLYPAHCKSIRPCVEVPLFIRNSTANIFSLSSSESANLMAILLKMQKKIDIGSQIRALIVTAIRRVLKLVYYRLELHLYLDSQCMPHCQHIFNQARQIWCRLVISRHTLKFLLHVFYLPAAVSMFIQKLDARLGPPEMKAATRPAKCQNWTLNIDPSNG